MKRTKEQNRKQGKASRRKGAEGELEASKLWWPWFPYCKRMFPRQQQGVKFPDIGCPDMNKRFYVEVKRRKKISDADVDRFWDKTEKDWFQYIEELGLGGDPEPLIMFREDGKGWQIAHRPEGINPMFGWMDNETKNGDGYFTKDSVIIVPWSDFERYLNANHSNGGVRE